MADSSYPKGLTDTDILVDAGRGFPKAIDFISALRPEGNLSISAITAMELLVGCANNAERLVVEKFLKTLTIVHVEEHISAQALNWIGSFRLSHGLLIPDALIAATALQHELTLFTKNGRHFQMLPGLQILRPY